MNIHLPLLTQTPQFVGMDSRARKIRCDSTRPHCNNCVRRGNDCEYDAKPKRRGPDKRPGTRQRSCKKRPPEAEPPTSIAKKKRKIEGEDDDGSSITFDERVGTTNGARHPSLVPATPIPDGGSRLRMPQAPPLVLDTLAQARGMSSEAIYPKVKYLVSSVSRGVPSTSI